MKRFDSDYIHSQFCRLVYKYAVMYFPVYSVDCCIFEVHKCTKHISYSTSPKIFKSIVYSMLSYLYLNVLKFDNDTKWSETLEGMFG